MATDCARHITLQLFTCAAALQPAWEAAHLSLHQHVAQALVHGHGQVGWQRPRRGGPHRQRRAAQRLAQLGRHALACAVAALPMETGQAACTGRAAASALPHGAATQRDPAKVGQVLALTRRKESSAAAHQQARAAHWAAGAGAWQRKRCTWAGRACGCAPGGESRGMAT